MVVPFGFGFGGNLVGAAYTSWHNSGFKGVDVHWPETLTASALAGTLNVFAGIASGMSSIVAEIGAFEPTLDAKYACRIIAGMIAGGAEALYVAASYFFGKLI